MNIVKPTLSDIDALIPLWEEQYRLHKNLDDTYYVNWSPELVQTIRRHLNDCIAKNSPRILAAKKGKDFVGFVTFHIDTDTYFDTRLTLFGEIIEIIVSHNHRRQGIGAALLAAVDNNYFAPQDIQDVRLRCSVANTSAQQFYEKQGFISRQIYFYKKLEGTRS